MTDTFSLWLNVLLNGLAVGMLYFLLASGLSLIFGLMSVLNFAHGAFFMLGAYAGLMVFNRTGSFWWGLAGGLVAGAIIGVLVELLAVRTVYGNHLYQALLTLGLGLVFEEGVRWIWGPTIQTMPPLPAYLTGSVDIGGMPFARYRLFLIVFGAVIMLLFWLFLARTKLGMTIRAGVENREVLQALGVNVPLIFTFVFALGGALAGLGGMAAAPFMGVHPGLGLDNGMKAFIIVVVGGFGSYAGAMAASLLVGIAGAFVAQYVPALAVAFNVGLMAIVLLLRPQGLLGKKVAG